MANEFVVKLALSECASAAFISRPSTMKLARMGLSEQKDDQVENRLENAVKDFLSNSSMHGLKYIGESSRYAVERVFWAFIFISSVAASGYLCFSLLDKWINNPLIVTYETENPQLDDFATFPAVTICSVGKVSERNMKKVINNLIQSHPTLTGDILDDAFLLMVLPRLARDIDKVSRVVEGLRSHNIDFETLRRQYEFIVPSCDDMIVDVTWKEYRGPGNAFFKPSPTDYGFCCTFNAGSYAVPAFGFPNHTSNLTKSQGTGRSNGLEIVLNSEVADHKYTLSDYKGFQVLVHNPDEYPKISENGFAVGIQSTTLVALDPVGYFHTPTVANLDLEKRNCIVEGEGGLKYFKKYTKSACMEECTVDNIIGTCKCRPHYFTDPKSDSELGICRPNHYMCVQNVTVGVQNGSVQCQCRKTCTNLWYDETVTSAPFPGPDFERTRSYTRSKEWIEKKRNLPFDEKNLSQLIIFIKREGQFYKMDVRYGPEDLISSVGGLLGLGLGFSLISAVELFYFFCIHFIATYTCRSQKVSWQDPTLTLNEHSLKLSRAVFPVDFDSQNNVKNTST